ncbi:hypothetical protein ACJRO7_007007 [Eucalyptus globulus]|uniref:Uncharacterized protein n=1 Tax=Eucalyptus globulus TaxID=34317 RepID=A0ABD3IN07_EUCGL
MQVFLCLQCWTGIYNLLKVGRMALFHVSLLSKYKERRIMSFRLQLEDHLQQVPEQVISTEVRRMVEEMQALNKKLEDTEAATEDYFKPIDKQAETIMIIQLEALLKKDEKDRLANAKNVANSNQHKQIPTRKEEMKA